MLVYLEMLPDDSDKAKLEQVYLRYRGLMFHAASRILNNSADAEDAVHQSFISIAEHIHKISSPVCTKTQSFVVSIVERKAIDIYRRKSKQRVIPLEDETAGLPVDTEAVQLSPLAAAISRLPARYRQFILLKYHCGYSNQEVADMLGLSYEGAHSLDPRAKKALRDVLEKEGVML